MFGKWFKKSVSSVKTFFSTNYNIYKSNSTPAQSSEIMRVVNKFASIYMDADVYITDQNGNIQNDKTKKLSDLLNSDPLYRGQNNLLNQLCKVALTQGGMLFKKTVINGEIKALDLLQPEHITALKDNRVNRLNIANFREFFKKLIYNDYYTSNVVPLDLNDISFFVDNPNSNYELNFCTRFAEIQDKINNSYYANNMLSSLLNRCAILFLSKRDKSEFSTLSTTTQTKERTQNFNEAYHVKNSAVVQVADNLNVLNTSIDVKSTGVFDAFEDTINAACNLLGITRTIIEIQGSTFSNQQGAIKDAIINGIQSFANKTGDFLKEMLLEHNMLDINDVVEFDYSEILSKNLASSSTDVQNIEQEQQQEQQQQQTEGQEQQQETEPIQLN